MSKDRNHYAQQLARIAMKLQRTPKDQQDKLLAAATRCLNGFKAAAHGKGSGERISNKVAPHLQEILPNLREFLGDTLEPYGYALLVFSTEEEGGRIDYVSNCDRPGVVASMREFIVAQESGE